MAQTCALIATVQPVLQRVSCSNETLPNAPKYYETHQNMCLGSNGVDRVRSLQKFRCDFMAKNFTLIAPVQPVLHQASCSNETIQNALVAPVQPILHRVWCRNEILPNTSKHYEMHTNMSLGSNGVDWVRLLWKILMRLHGMNFCINCTSSTHFAPSFV